MFSIKSLSTKQVYICIFFLFLSVASIAIYPVMETFWARPIGWHYHPWHHASINHNHDQQYVKRDGAIKKQDFDRMRNEMHKELHNDLQQKQLSYEAKLNEKWLQATE